MDSFGCLRLLCRLLSPLLPPSSVAEPFDPFCFEKTAAFVSLLPVVNEKQVFTGETNANKLKHTTHTKEKFLVLLPLLLPRLFCVDSCCGWCCFCAVAGVALCEYLLLLLLLLFVVAICCCCCSLLLFAVVRCCCCFCSSCLYTMLSPLCLFKVILIQLFVFFFLCVLSCVMSPCLFLSILLASSSIMHTYVSPLLFPLVCF